MRSGKASCRPGEGTALDEAPPPLFPKIVLTRKNTVRDIERGAEGQLGDEEEVADEEDGSEDEGAAE